MQPTDVSISSLVWQQFWQCSALVLTVWLICRLVRFRRSHLTCLLWLVVLLKFITPPVWDSSMGLFCWIQSGLPANVSPSQPPEEPEFLTRTESTRLLTGDDMGKLPDVSASPDFKVTIHENETSRQTPVRSETTTVPVQPTAENIGQPAAHYSVKEMGVVIWITVGLLIATVMLVRYLRCWHIIRRAGEQSHPELNQLLARLCSELKLKRRVRLLITHSRMGPAVIGLLRPTIILPTAITESRSLKALEPVLAHELIHIRRGDLWIGLLQLLASVVWWFHPLVWFTGRRLKFEIEQCCDEEVLAELNCDPRQYAACLLEILELKQTLKAVPVVPGVRPVEITSKRLERIMRLGQGCQKRTPWWCWMIFVTLAAVVLPGAGFVVSAADQAEEQLPHSNKEEHAGSLNSVKDPIQALPFYDPIKRAANSNNLFSRSYSKDLAYLSAEIDMRDWISRSVCTREYSIKELLDKTSKNMGPMRAEAVLKEKLHARLKLLREFAAVNERPDYSTSIPVYCETHQIPLKDERKQCRMVSYGGSCIRDDRLIVWAKDERYHKLVEQALDELSREEMTPFVLTAKFISVPRGLLDKISSERRQVKVYQAEKTAVVSDAAAGEQPELIGPETISHPSLICEILDEKRVREVQRIIKSSTDTQTISAPQVRFIDGQTVQLETKKRHELEPEFRGAGQSFSVKNYDVGLDLRVTFSTRRGIQNRGMLDYQITSSEYAGLKKQKLSHPETGMDAEPEVPVIKEWHFKDARLLEPGQVLLVEGLELQYETDSKNVLLALFQVERVRHDGAGKLLLGVGVNSDAGVTGQIRLNEENFETQLLTESYPVKDLVVPIPQQFTLPYFDPLESKKQEAPRFEPLIQLIQKNVTPDQWKEPVKTGCTIRVFEQNLSLIIRQTRSGHDQIADLLEKIRAVQNRMLRVGVRFISAGNLQNWYEHWDASPAEEAKAFSDRMRTAKLREGIIINRSEASLIKLAARRLVPYADRNVGRENFCIHRHTSDLPFPDLMVEGAKRDCHIQLHPVILEQDQVQISMIVNPDEVEDSLSNLKRGTIPQEHTLLVDITEQITGQKHSLLPSELQGQVLAGQEQQNRYLLLVTPSKPDNITKLRITPHN
ncbi:M56 family metallopeptidase [Gimesia sp.]|uniref:M56 family metallopeptidase n=1 Tax=Gimesia sp. TaxID=2024833 RepID=UPI000C60FBAD|nr:M56 family metallopeptidase [Gimesia sp.]MAX35453.1 hypothetical protein [Gimesia sp.]|tara:strand:+ start:9445 stop:12801 length:3357 start_codon:yes stop_codon:yes gene_type:complete